MLCSSCFPNHLLPVFTAQSCCTAFFQGSVAKLRKKLFHEMPPSLLQEVANLLVSCDVSLRALSRPHILICHVTCRFPGLIRVCSFLVGRSMIILTIQFEIPRDCDYSTGQKHLAQSQNMGYLNPVISHNLAFFERMFSTKNFFPIFNILCVCAYIYIYIYITHTHTHTKLTDQQNLSRWPTISQGLH